MNNLFRCLNLVIPGVLLLGAADAQAAIVYNDRDLILGFRQSSGIGSATSLEFDLGSASLFEAAGAPFTVGDASLLNSTFGAGLLNVSFTAGAAQQVGSSPDPLRTLWITEPRADVTLQTTPWLRKSASNQSTTTAKIGSMGSQLSVGTATSVANAVTLANSDANSYGALIGANGNFGTFQGGVENSTPNPFTTRIVSDLYKLTPSTQAGNFGTFLGYFELNSSGTMQYVPATSPVPEPSTYAAIAGVALIAFSIVRKSRTAKVPSL